MGIYLSDNLTAHPTGSDIPAAGNVILYPLGDTWYKMSSNGVPVLLELNATQIAALNSAVQPGDDISVLNNNLDFQTQAEVVTLVNNAVTTHENAANPHPQYETSAEAQAKVDTHAALPNPHNMTPATIGTLTTAQINALIQQAKDDLTNGASAAADTLAELETLINDNDTDITGLLTQIGNLQNSINAHIAATGNVHGLTPADINLGNVNNTSDANKPVSGPQQAALNLKANQAALDVVNTALTLLQNAYNVDAIKRDGSVTFNQNQSMGNNKLINVGDPTANKDAANKEYVDNAISRPTVVRETQGKVNTSNSTWRVMQSVVFNVPAGQAGEYMVSNLFTWSYNTTGTDFEARLRKTTGTASNLDESCTEPKDSGGTGLTLPNQNGGTTNSGTDQRLKQTLGDTITLAAGNHTFELQFQGQSNGIAAAVYKSLMKIERVN